MDATAGFELFGNGLSYKLEMSVNDHDQMFRLTQRKLYEGNKTPTTYLLMQNVKCEDGAPERLQRLTLQEGIYNPQKRASVRLKDLDGLSRAWVTSLQGKDHPFRMVRVDNEQSYMQLLHRLEELLDSGDIFIVRDLTHEQQDILINLILKEISHFSHRKDLIPNSRG